MYKRVLYYDRKNKNGYITIPLIIIPESENISEISKNGELYELVEKWKQIYESKSEPYTYTISLEDLKDWYSYMTDYIDSEIIYTYDEREKVYIFSFYGELIGLITDKEIMNKEMKSLTKLVEKL